MGLVVNHPSDHALAEILRSVNMPVPDTPLPLIYYGGPVEMEAAFILFPLIMNPNIILKLPTP